MKNFLIIIMSLCVMLPACYAETVVYNVKTHKYHKPGCTWAIKCTVNCIKLEKKEAVSRGGVPCKVCGG